MSAAPLSKSEMLTEFHLKLKGAVVAIGKNLLTREAKAKEVNARVSAVKQGLDKRIALLPEPERPNQALTLQYCYSVASLEYRHRVWPYEYMAFSRRVGELWEAFCAAAWDYPTRKEVKRISPPTFDGVRKVLRKRLVDNIGTHHKGDELLTDIDILFEIIGDINMREDEVFVVRDVPHVLDFKSGFGSNEKGNMLRLMAVGRAYRLWNQATKLLLLVRQDENNNYLNVLRREGLWEVHTGRHAYAQIAGLTGADMQSIRDSVVDWKSDLSSEFYHYLRKQPKPLIGYLAW